MLQYPEAQFLFFGFGARKVSLRNILGIMKVGGTTKLYSTALLLKGACTDGSSQSGAEKLLPAHYKECSLAWSAS